MEQEHLKILISYGKQIRQVKLKHRLKLNRLLLGAINGVSFTMFVYVLLNVFQIIFN